MKKTAAVFARIQNYFGVRTRKEMMGKWGIPYSSYKTWVHRDHIPHQRLSELAEKEGLNIAWIVEGTNPKYSVAPIDDPKFLTPEMVQEFNNHVAETIPNYGTDKRTIKIAKTFDALDDDVKDEVLETMLNFMRGKL